ncbi:MAG: glycoside hydrolase family 172 protein [Opitutaceae bacterium]
MRKTKQLILATLTIASACLTGHTAIGSEITIESLLNEMVDRESLVRYPEKNFRLKQHSSYNRASKTPDEPKGWFTNRDYNGNDKDANFIRIEENDGRKEWVLMDHEGPGAIVRIWMPWRDQLNADTSTQLMVYLDGAEEPVIVGNMLGLFDGTGMIPYPMAHPSLRSAVSFFPIPYAKSCKVTVDERPFFHQFTFREYDEGTKIKTFTMDDFEAAKELTANVGDTLLNPPSLPETIDSSSINATIQPEGTRSLTLPAGTGSIREISVKLDDYTDPAITREVVLLVEFDDEQRVWCPIGDFFGSGIGMNPHNGWFYGVAEDGTMTSRWIMPYQNSARVSLLNLSGATINAELEVKTGSWEWDERTMYFNAAWRGQYPVPTRPFSDWNYVSLEGRGVYVGDTLTIMNPVKRWWGEGDERIWVDGEDFPSIFGTGTEDYYAYSWGGRSTDFYDHPFHAQPFSHKYNKLNRKTTNEKNTMGFSVETRSRALDTMPFESALQLDMEVWSGTDCDMGYQVGVCWYAFEETTSNIEPTPEEIPNLAPLPEKMK